MTLLKQNRTWEESSESRNKLLYKQFFKRLLTQKTRVYSLIALMFLAAGFYVTLPLILKEGLQRLYFMEQEINSVLGLAVFLIIASTILMIIKERLLVKFSQEFVRDLKKDLFKGVLKKSITKFKNIGVGRILAFISYNTGLIKSLVNDWGAIAIQQVINFMALFVTSFFIDKRLALLFCLMLPIFTIYLLIVQHIVKTYALQLVTLNKQIFENLHQTLEDFENVKLLTLEEKKSSSFNKLLDQDTEIRIDRTLIYEYNKIIVRGISLLLVVAFTAIGGHYLNMQEMDFSQFVFFVLYIHLLFRPFEIAVYTSAYYEAGKIGIQTVFPYISTSAFNPVSRTKFNGDIKIKDASYRYKRSKFKLNRINLDLKKGDKVTIVGDNNSGKSTFIQMLLQFQKLRNGKIYFNGEDACDINPRTIRKNVGIISKDYLLTNETIINFLQGKNKREGLSHELIELCSEMDLNEKIVSLGSRKYENKIFKNDARFSETEKLKLALIRVAYQEVPIILLDNFWHNFDSKTKAKITDFISKYCQGITIIQLTSLEKDLLLDTVSTYRLDNGKISAKI